VTDIYDYLGRKYELVNSAEIPELKGDGGLLSFSRTEVTITVNDTITISFALHVKPPALLYINGKPCTKNVLYMPVTGTDGYTYGVYFSEVVYKFAKNSRNEDYMVRSMAARVAKCLSLL
jgi:hypothetical protein